MPAKRQRKAELQAQAAAVGAVALEAQSATQRDKALKGAETLSRLARQADKAERAALAEPILELADNATPKEVFAARLKRAVRRGRDVYLPTWTDLTVGLPNVWLRSALFSASKNDRGWLDNEELLTQGDVTLTYTGQALRQHDQQVYATCLDFYKTDRPLSPGGTSPWVQTTYYQFVMAMGRTYGANVHTALRESLIRLNSANLRIRHGRLDIPIPRLLEVAFDDSLNEGLLRGSDLIAFRVHESVANLFGPNSWSAVPKDALNYQGLQAWLAAYYSSHSVMRWVPLESLQKLSGLQCKLSDFRRLVETALTKMKSEDLPEEMRVAEFFPKTFTRDTKAVMVCMASWKEARSLAKKGYQLPLC